MEKFDLNKKLKESNYEPWRKHNFIVNFQDHNSKTLWDLFQITKLKIIDSSITHNQSMQSKIIIHSSNASGSQYHIENLIRDIHSIHIKILDPAGAVIKNLLYKVLSIKHKIKFDHSSFNDEKISRDIYDVYENMSLFGECAISKFILKCAILNYEFEENRKKLFRKINEINK